MAKQNKAFEFGPFRLEVRERRLTREGYPVPMRGRVFDTLYALVSRHGCLVTKDELMAAIWPDSVVEETNLNHNICVLRRALGEKATGQMYVETVPRQGYRFVALVKELECLEPQTFPHHWKIAETMTSAPELLQPAIPSPLGSVSRQVLPEGREDLCPGRRRPWRSSRPILSLLAVSVLVVATYFTVEQIGSRAGASHSRVMLAVLPFENLTGDSSEAYIAEGFNREITSQLGRWNIARIGVIAHTSTRAYQATHKSISEIGRELRADYIVEGSLRRQGDRYRITLMLVGVDSQAHLWAANYTSALDEATAVQIQIARAAVNQIGRTIGVEPKGSYLGGYPGSTETSSPDSRHSSALIHPEDKHSAVALPSAAEK